MPVDIEIYNGGSIFLFTMLTDAAREWLLVSVSAEPWQWLGNSLAVEYRYAEELAAGAVAAGLTVR